MEDFFSFHAAFKSLKFKNNYHQIFKLRLHEQYDYFGVTQTDEKETLTIRKKGRKLFFHAHAKRISR